MLSSKKICWTLGSKGSTQSGFPPKMEYLFRAHLFKKQKQRLDNDKQYNYIVFRSISGSSPVKVVLEATQTLNRAQVLVNMPFSIPSGHVFFSTNQCCALTAALDASGGHVHPQLWEETVLMRLGLSETQNTKSTFPYQIPLEPGDRGISDVSPAPQHAWQHSEHGADLCRMYGTGWRTPHLVKPSLAASGRRKGGSSDTASHLLP